MTRRHFVCTAATGIASAVCGGCRTLADDWYTKGIAPFPGVPIIDIHQHCDYGKVGARRPDSSLPQHQRNMGVRTTVLLPAATSGTLGGWTDAGNEVTLAFAQEHPAQFVSFANENIFRSEAPKVIANWLEKGAVGVGEIKDNIECDGPEMRRVAEVANEFRVPMLIHFQNGMFIGNYHKFHRILERYPKVNFIAHAQSTWAHVDAKYKDSMGYLPKGNVTPGGLTDQWLKNYPNFFGDLAAIEGNHFLTRDPEFARDFLGRHQDKLLYGSDCPDSAGTGSSCVGATKLNLLKQLLPSESIRDKILFRNARRILRLPRQAIG